MLLKRILFNVLGFIVFLLIFFVVGEIAFRIFRGPPNPLTSVVQKEKKYLFEPNSSFSSQSSKEGEFEYTAHINSFGYRGKDFSQFKNEGRLRILAVGDSFTFGVGANDDQTIPSLIEQHLQEQGLDVEVINAGIGHASPITHHVNLRDIHLKYNPDLVLLLFDFTDLWDDWHSERQAVFDKKGDIAGFDERYVNGKLDWWIVARQHSAFCKYVHDKIMRTFEKIGHLGIVEYAKAVIHKQKAKAVIINSDDPKLDKVQIYYDGLLMMRGREKRHLIDEHWQRTAKYLKKVHHLLGSSGISLILVTYPHGIYVDEKQWDMGRETWGFERNRQYTDYYPFELVEQFAREEGVPCINTLPHFLKAPSDLYFYDWDGHMTPKGYSTVAQGIVSSPALKSYLDSIALDTNL